MAIAESDKVIFGHLTVNFNSMITDLIKKEVSRAFCSSDHTEVFTELEKCHPTMIGDELERVLLAIVHLSMGRCDRLKLFVRDAEQDWRDVLIAAGLAFENWREVIRNSGNQ
jgi:hypothetical protein